MKLGQLSSNESKSLLQHGRLRIRVGPYVYQIHSNLKVVHQGLETLYSDFELAVNEDFYDYDISLRSSSLKSRIRRNVDFYFENERPFNTIHAQHAYAFLEWGMNWCVSIHANEYLKLHAAVVAKRGKAIVMPGIPGAGKSTLCAALGLRGWRILSDEHALIPPGTAEVVPLYRPVSLKNESISVIKNFEKTAVFGPTSTDTHKGTVAHLKADLEADCHDQENIQVKTIIFPRYSADEDQQLSARSRTQSFMIASYHSFNYSLLGPAGFHAMKLLINAADCYDLVYRDLDWAVQAIENLHNEVPK